MELRRAPPRRARPAARSVVAWYQQRARLGNARPRRHLHDRRDPARTDARAHLAQALPEPAAPVLALRTKELQLLALVLGELEQLDLQARHRPRQLGELRNDRHAQPRRLGRRLAQRDRPPPGAAADELRRQAELARRLPAAVLAGEHALEQHGEPTPQGQLVADRLGERERLRERLDRPPWVHASVLVSSRQAPGAPAVRPQTFGDGATREPGKLSDLAHAQLLELLVALPLEREQRQRERCEEFACRPVRDDERLPPACARCGRERGEPPLGGTGARLPRL